MSRFTVELSEKATRQHCNCCSQDQLTVWGLIHQDDVAHAVYYAYLHPEETGKPGRMMSLTISMGVWGGSREELPNRDWVQLKVRDDFQMMIRNPQEAVLFGSQFLGRPLAREDALKSPLRSGFFAIADFVVANDPAVFSFLSGKAIDLKGRRESTTAKREIS